MVRIFELMEEHMPAPSGSKDILRSVSSRVSELGIILPDPPTPLGAYVESSDSGKLLFLTGMLPVVHGKLTMTGCLGENLSVKEGQEAARIAAFNALAVAKQHLGNLDRLKKLVKLTVVMVANGNFVDHAPVADGASKIFLEIFGPQNGHSRVVFGVQSMPIGAPVMVETVFEFE